MSGIFALECWDMAVLKVEGLRKSFRTGIFKRSPEILRGIEFSIEPGTITGFLGANGAGKTTTLKCLLELIHADSGSVSFFGEKGLSIESRKKIGFLPERPYFYDYLTGVEFLSFYGKLSGRISRGDLPKRVQQLLGRVQLEHAKDRALREYSKGMLQRIGVAQALIHRPEFIILDEPMSGLDPDGRFDVQEIIRQTAGDGTAVFFSSHLLHDAEQLCDQLVVLKQGAVVYEGATSELLAQFSSKTVVSYHDNGQLCTRTVAEGQDLSAVIDELRAKNLEIIEVKKERQGLEAAFMAMAYGGGRKK